MIVHIALHESILSKISDDFYQEDSPLIRSDIIILVPSRRLGRNLESVLLEKVQSVILPLILPFSEGEESIDYDLINWNSFLVEPVSDFLPPAPAIVRIGLIQKLIEAWQTEQGLNHSPVQSIKLAHSLKKFIDKCILHNITKKQLEDLVPQEFATHWGITLDFLKIFFDHWPRILEEAGYSEPELYFKHLIDTKIDSWQECPPKNPIWAIVPPNPNPTITKLLQAINSLPSGRLYFSGLDDSISDKILLSPPHPQMNIKKLLHELQSECIKERKNLYKF